MEKIRRTARALEMLCPLHKEKRSIPSSRQGSLLLQTSTYVSLSIKRGKREEKVRAVFCRVCREEGVAVQRFLTLPWKSLRSLSLSLFISLSFSLSVCMQCDVSYLSFVKAEAGADAGSCCCCS